MNLEAMLTTNYKKGRVPGNILAFARRSSNQQCDEVEERVK